MPISLKSLLLESQDQLFHATEIHSLLKILDNDAIKLTYADSIGSEEKLNRGYPFYLSTSREKYSGYARARTDKASIPVVLVLNGRALERTKGVKMFDVDYWGKSFETPENLRHSETEERVVSDHQTLQGVKKYVSEIHVYIRKRYYDPVFTSTPERAQYFVYNELIPIAEKAKSIGVPIFFYMEDITPKADPAFRQQRKNMALDADQMVTVIKDKSRLLGVKDGPVDQPERQSSRYEQSDIKDLEVLAKIIVHPEEYIDVDYSSNKELYELVNYFVNYKRDLVSHFGTKIHNLRSKHPDVFQSISRAIRSMKYTNFKDALNTTSDVISFLKDANNLFKDTRNDRITNLRYIVNHYSLDGKNSSKSEISKYLLGIKEKSHLDKNDLKELTKLFKMS